MIYGRYIVSNYFAMRLFFLYLLGMLTYVQVGYTQCISGVCDNGQGTYRFSDGSIYVGAFKNGLPDGEGIWEYPQGGKVKGTFKKGLPVGEAAFVKTPVTKRKTGCLSGNCRNGIGVYLDESGNQYVGYFKKHIPSGKGICYYPDGSRYDGFWKAGLPNGYGTLFDVKGEQLEGYWDKGQLTPDVSVPQILEEHTLLETPKQETYAVVIGIADYAKMDVLDYSDDDAYNFYALLEKQHLPSDHIRFLVDGNATAKNIESAIQDVAERAGENDKIVIYYSGHGIEKAIIPFESDGKTGLVLHQEISQILQQSAAKSKTLYIDACNVDEPEAHIQNNNNVDDLTIFYSSSPGENSLESNELQHGVFSYYLIDGLKGSADQDGDGQVTMPELYHFVFTNVKNYTDQQQYPSLVIGGED
ncbi:MAG TPA: hypothetical protein ENK85_00505 [Saprospiraceae bacterium]|nr:hypothetical protein [Saprospiraceae bacterium]